MTQRNTDTPNFSGTARLIASAILWMVVIGFGIGLVYFIIVPGQRAARISSTIFWYGVPALALLLAAWALRSPVERRVAVALLLVSVFGSVLVGEAALRAFPPRVAGFSFTTTEADSICPGEWRNRAGCLAAAAADSPFDRRSTLEVIRDFEAQGIEAWPSIDASHYVDSDYAIEVEGSAVVPLSPGLPGVLTVFCNESGDWITYVADEYGFNNPPASHRADEIDVALVGDSFVHGWCAPFEKTLVGRIRQGDSTMLVLGVGLEGSGPLTQLGIEREYLEPLRPATVVWLFFEGNDLRDLSRDLTNGVLLRYLDPGFHQGLRDLGSPLDRALSDQIAGLRIEEEVSALAAREQRESARRRRESVGGWMRLTEIRARLKDLGRSRKPAHPYDPALFDQIASRMRDDVAAWGGTLLFAYLPSRHRFEDPTTANPHRADILARVRALGIPTIDLFEPLAAHPDPLSLYPFRVENHFTAKGYDLVARALRESIMMLESGPYTTRTRTLGNE